MKKSNVGKTGGINTNAIIGGVVGGVVNAAVDKYVVPHLPNSESLPIAPLVKVAAGIGLPMLVKGNAMMNVGATALLACGVSDLTKKMVFSEKKTAIVEDPAKKSSGLTGLGDVEGITYVGAQNRIPFPSYAALAGLDDEETAPSNGKVKQYVG